MKKNIKKYLLSTILFAGIMMFSSEVKAADIVKDDVPNSTYVIGTHMFTRDKNEETGYNGQLTTKNIMLAAKTIKGDTVNDMVIYYKNPRGKWTDPLTGSETQVPDKFEINYKNLALEDVKAPGAPILHLKGPEYYDEKTGDVTYLFTVFVDDVDNKANTPFGVEIQVCKDKEVSFIDLNYEEKIESRIIWVESQETVEFYDNLLIQGKGYHFAQGHIYI